MDASSQIVLGFMNEGLSILSNYILVLEPLTSEESLTLNEVKEAISQVKGGKAAGIWDIPAELLKARSQPMARACILSGSLVSFP